MEELTSLVMRAQTGDLNAYGAIVRRFQDMAYGCGYSLLGDFHLAEDAAQEAFIEAYRDLPKLREPAAFPGWFRRIVFKHCDRLTRGKRVSTVPLQAAAEMASRDPDPAEVVEKREIKDKVLDAIHALPENERMVTTLFYINGYSQKEIAAFLDVPITTVKNRLHTSRKRLKERMVHMVADELKSYPLSPEFPERIRLLLELPRPLDIEGHPVHDLWEAFRSCLPDFEVVPFDEVYNRALSLLRPEHFVSYVYEVDDQNILRPELTSQMMDFWLRKGDGPGKWVTVGRVFRKGHKVSETILEVHHQAEVLWCEEGLAPSRLAQTIQKVASKLLPGIPCREGTPMQHSVVPDGKHYEAPWQGQWLRIAAGGMVADEWMAKAGLDPDRYGAISFAFGLERCAQVRYDLDDVRKLWQPPYVPA